MTRSPTYEDMPRISERKGIPKGTLKSLRHRGQMPAPDMMLGIRPLWRTSTIDRWWVQFRNDSHEGKP